MESSQALAVSPDSMRRAISVVIATSFCAMTLLTLLQPDDNPLNTSLSVTATAAIATGAAFIVVAKQKISGLYGRTYLSLAIGLCCWLAGQAVYSYDSLVASSASSLSLADALWLVSYAFFGYYVFKTYQFYGFAVKRSHMLCVLAGVSIMMAMTAYSVLDSIGGSVQSEPLLLIRLVYPAGDAVLMAPSILLLVTLRTGLLTYTPWLFVSVGLILIAAADIAFINMSLLQTENLGIIFYPLYNAANLAFAGALIWYRKFGIYDHGRALAEFQKENR